MITLDTEDLNDHQSRLLDLLCEEFEQAPFLDATNGPGLYRRLRTHLTAAGQPTLLPARGRSDRIHLRLQLGQMRLREIDVGLRREDVLRFAASLGVVMQARSRQST